MTFSKPSPAILSSTGSFSRRSFVVALAALYGCAGEAFALARKPKPKPEAVIGGPRTIARQEWPPAITPEFVGIVDKGYACFADDMGRIAVVDLKRQDNPAVIGELFGLGRRVSGVVMTQHNAFAVAQIEDGQDVKHLLVSVSLTPPSDLTVLSRFPLDMFEEPTCVAAGGDVIAVGGLGPNGERRVALFGLPKKKATEPSLLATFPCDQLPVKMDIQERQLLLLSGTDSSALTLIGLANPRSPEIGQSVRLEGAFSCMARFKDQVLVAGRAADRSYQARLLTLRPQMTLRRDVTLKAVTDVLDVAAQKGQFLILVGGAGGRQSVLPIIVDRKAEISAGTPAPLPAGKRGSAPRAHIAVKERDAYVASDWGGVQVLSYAKTGWQFSFSHTIPRLPASALVLSGTKAVLACADLKVYDLSDPAHPILTGNTEISSTIRAMVGVGRSVMCLAVDTLTLRPVDSPGSVLAQAKAVGNALALDRAAGRAYVLNAGDKTTTVTPLRVTEETLRTEASFDVDGIWKRAYAVGNTLLLAGLSDVALYNPDGTEQLGKRTMPNLAIRDIVLTSTGAVLACIDQNLKGHLVLLSLPDLNIVGATDLPQDAACLAVSGGTAVVIGRDSKGKDTASLVSISNPVQLKVLESFNVLEAASAVTIADKVAVIGGRGIEIISLA